MNTSERMTAILRRRDQRIDQAYCAARAIGLTGKDADVRAIQVLAVELAVRDVADDPSLIYDLTDPGAEIGGCNEPLLYVPQTID